MSAAPVAPDADWLRITDGLSPYERFRFIATHVLSWAVREASAYAADPRIFTDVDGPETLRAHLSLLDAALKDDKRLTPAEREFLCGAVAAALRELDADAACLYDLVKARRAGPDGSANR